MLVLLESAILSVSRFCNVTSEASVWADVSVVIIETSLFAWLDAAASNHAKREVSIMTTLTSAQTEASEVTLQNLETERIALSRRTSMHGFPRFLVACFLVLFPMIVMSQDYT